jgi:hypothetical protein
MKVFWIESKKSCLIVYPLKKTKNKSVSKDDIFGDILYSLYVETMHCWNTCLKIFINLSVSSIGTDILGRLYNFIPLAIESLMMGMKKCCQGQQGDVGHYDVVVLNLGLLINLTENDKINCNRVAEFQVNSSNGTDNEAFLAFLTRSFIDQIFSSEQSASIHYLLSIFQFDMFV